jgi:hypothetical protein
MSFRIPIGPAAALFEEGVFDFAPVPAERVTHFADTPVAFIADSAEAIRLPAPQDAPERPAKGHHYH